MRFPRRGESGFTLMELLVAIVLGGIVITLLYSLFINSLKVQSQTLSITAQSQNVQTKMHAIERELRNSRNALVGTEEDILVLSYFIGDKDDVLNGQSSGSWGCKAYVISPDGVLYSSRNADNVRSVVSSNSPPTSYENWKVELEDLHLDYGSGFKGEKNSELALGQNLSSGDIVSMFFSLGVNPGVGGGDPAPISSASSVTLRAQTNGGEPCW